MPGEARKAVSAEEQGFAPKVSARAKEKERAGAEPQDFSRGREAAAVKILIRDAEVTPAQTGHLREYMKLMDDLDAAQQVLNKGTKAQRETALVDIKELAELARDNRADLKKAGLDVHALGLEKKDNRKLFVRERRDIFKPSEKDTRENKAGAKVEMKNVATETVKEFARGLKAARETFTETQATAVKGYLAGMENTNRIHADLVAVRRQVDAAHKEGSSDLQELNKIEEATSIAYAESRAELKKTETAVRDAGVDPSMKVFSTKDGRAELYEKSPQLKPKEPSKRLTGYAKMRQDRQDRIDAETVIAGGEDPSDAAEDTLGFLPGPDDAKDGSVRPLMRVNRGADGRVIRGGTPEMGNKDSRPVDVSESAPDMIDLNSPLRAEEQRMREISAETKKAAAERARVEALTEAQRLEEAMLGKDFAMAKSAPAKTPAEKPGFFSRIAGFDVGSAARRLLLGLGLGLAAGKGVDTMRNHDQSPESAPTHQAYNAAETQKDYSIRAETPAAHPATQAVETGSADATPAPETVTPSAESTRHVEATRTARHETSSDNGADSEPELTALEKFAAGREAIRKVRDWDGVHPDTFGLTPQQAERMLKGDPKNLLDAISIWKDFPGKAEYRKLQAKERLEVTKQALSDIRTISEVVYGPSPALEAYSKAEASKKIEAANKAWKQALDSASPAERDAITAHLAEQQALEDMQEALELDDVE